MSRYVSKCAKCGREMRRGDRRQLAFMREYVHGRFVSDGFSVYVCPSCSSKMRDMVSRWCDAS